MGTVWIALFQVDVDRPISLGQAWISILFYCGSASGCCWVKYAPTRGSRAAGGSELHHRVKRLKWSRGILSSRYSLLSALELWLVCAHRQHQTGAPGNASGRDAAPCVAGIGCSFVLLRPIGISWTNLSIRGIRITPFWRPLQPRAPPNEPAAACRDYAHCRLGSVRCALFTSRNMALVRDDRNDLGRVGGICGAD